MKSVLSVMCVSVFACWFHTSTLMCKLSGCLFSASEYSFLCTDVKKHFFNSLCPHREEHVAEQQQFLCVNILYMDRPEGLDMPFLCSGEPLGSSCWKGRLD